MSATIEHPAPTLFRHTKRKEWGLGRVTSEGPLRRRIQFEDGEERVIAKDYYHLLEAVDDATVESTAALDELVADARAESGMKARKPKKLDISPSAAIDEQIEAFKEKYPQGFQDPSWKAEVRGVGAGRKVKRYREPVVEEAQAVLSKDALPLIESDGAGAVFERVHALLGNTDLAVVKTDVKPLEDLDAKQREDFVQAVAALVAEDNVTAPKVDGFVAALKGLGLRPTWSLVSTILALSDPDAHGPVKPATIRKQAQRLGIQLKLANQAGGRSYLTAQQVLQTVRRRIEDKGLVPRDYLDVADFVGQSLSGLKSSK